MIKAIQRQVNSHRKWLTNTGESILDRCDQKLSTFDGRSMASVASSLSSLATYYGIRGVVALTDGQESGLNDVAASIDLRAWAMRLELHSYYNLGFTHLSMTGNVSIAACIACLSPKWEKVAVDFLGRAASDSGTFHGDFFRSRIFEPFVFTLCSAQDVPSPSNSEGPYNEIVKAWTDDSALQVTLHGVCDYHCSRIVDSGGDWDPEFKLAPFDLLPCEVMLVRRVRARSNLLTPSVNHDLVNLAFSDHELSTRPESAIVQRVSKYYGSVFGNGV